MRFHFKPEQPKLDPKDRKLIALLAGNARQPVSELSRQLKLSRDAVSYRLKRLQEKGILLGTRTFVDVTRFGWHPHHIFLKLVAHDEAEEDNIIRALIALPFTRAVIRYSGKYDIELAIIAKSTADLDTKVARIIAACGIALHEYEILNTIGSYCTLSLPRAFLAEAPETPKKQAVATDGTQACDPKDMEILKHIAEDAMKPAQDVARATSQSIDSVIRRLKRMQASGIITSFVPFVSFAKLGMAMHAVVARLQGLTQAEEKELKALLQNDPNVFWAIKTLGRWNLQFYTATENRADLHATISSLRRNFKHKLREYEVLLAFSEHKYTYFPEACWQGMAKA